MHKLRSAALAAFALAVAGSLAWGAGEFSTLPQVGQPAFSGGTSTGSSGTVSTTTVPAGPSFLTGSELVPADTGLAGGAAPQTVTIPVPMLGNFYGTPRNFLRNGALNLTSVNGTSTVTGQINAAAAVATNLVADGWLLSTNVAVGAGRSAIVTSSPSPPAGFTNVAKVFRTSGALTQPVCVHQAVPTPQATQLAGQVVTFSFWADALAGLAADNNNQISAVVYTGTGTDQGFGSWTASPAITPAWTGIATAVNQTLTITTTFTRYAVSATIPSTATEVGVAICFTPTATGAGSTDGFAFTGAQLERSPGASPYEVRSKQQEIIENAQFVFVLNEGAATATRAMCQSATTSLQQCGFKFPVPMYAVPTMTYTNGFASCTTTACSALTACVALRTSTAIAGSAPTVFDVPLDCTSAAAFPAAGSATFLADNGGSGKIVAWTGL